MKKQLFPLLLGLVFPLISWCQNVQPITLEDVWLNDTFKANSVDVFNFMKDGRHYTRLEDNKINMYDFVSGELVATLVDGASLDLPGEIDAYEFSAGEDKLILRTATTKIYRRSTKAFFYIYDLESNDLRVVFEGGKHRLATFNPQGTMVAFVYDNNLFYHDLTTTRVRRITTDGQFNSIINGATDWVYEEEFKVDKGFSWSPDGSQIAFYRVDESAVREFTIMNHNDELYPEYVTFKYPKVGETNSDITIHIYDLESEETTQVAQTDEEWEYFPRIKWSNEPGELCVFYLNRHQNQLELRLVNADRESRTLLQESSEYYIDIHDNLHFLQESDQFVWTSELDGWNHVYLYDMEGELVEQITAGEWEVTDFYGLDEANGMIYYQAARPDPLQRQVFGKRIGEDGKARILAGASGNNEAKFSSTFDYFLLTHSAINSPASYTVVDREGMRLRLIEDNTTIQAKQQTYGTATVEFFEFTTEDDVQLDGYMIKPRNFNPNVAYPVMMYVYGGPGSQKVRNQWIGDRYWWFQHLAQKGIIVACVDNRGTGARGEAFQKMTYLQLGHYETEDQIEAARYLGSQSYIDANRIGIFGWSYGGYMSSLCILKASDVFKAAIAVAPVTNWKWYDSVYTERYMRTVAENGTGYRDNSPVYFAEHLEDPYLLIHGMSDDNVHFQHSVEMANALIEANKQFDTYFYPNKNHSILGKPTRLHLYTRMTDFLLEEVKGRGAALRSSGGLQIVPRKSSNN